MNGPIPNCPPGWLALICTGLASLVLGVLIGWRARDWQVLFLRIFNHSQQRGEGE